MLKYKPGLLKEIEDLLKEAGYTVRYEKGNFQNGYCILEKRKVAVINKFHEPEAKINSMIEILMTAGNLELDNLSGESLDLYEKIKSERMETLFG